jgi:N-methylhydantoinase B
MTNTMNTPAEALELTYPFRLVEYRVRRGSAGGGSHRGGDGIVRTYEFLSGASLTLLTERRSVAPWGLAGGKAGAMGRNLLQRAGSVDVEELPAKVQLKVRPGDRLTIETPGGGGWGAA